MKTIMLVVACCAAAVGFCEPGQAEFEKGNACLNGTGVPQDPGAAFAWFRKSAVKGYLPAETEIGRCYEFGIGVRRDVQKAVDWYVHAAERDDVKALNALGALFGWGPIEYRDRNKAKFWFMEACKKNDPDALYYMGLLYNGEDGAGDKANEYFKRAAALGQKDAMSSLALAQLGSPDADSKKKGLEAMTKLAEEGVVDAQCSLGMAYEYGLSGFERNDAKAIEWCTRASSNGNAIAMCILGDRYAVGRGVAKDENRAFALFKKAAPNSSVGAYHLGVAYEKGIGCEKDEKRAFAAYDRAAKEGHLAAQYEVAERYGQGNGVEADDAKAEHWWKQAAENGKVKSFGDLEWIFRHGNECDIAEGRARALYRNAAARGDTDAMLRLGMSYYDLSKNAWTDRELGRSWIEKAAKRGHRFASNLLKQMDESSATNKDSVAN